MTQNSFPIPLVMLGQALATCEYTAIMSQGDFLGSPVGREGEGTGKGYWEAGCVPQTKNGP